MQRSGGWRRVSPTIRWVVLGVIVVLAAGRLLIPTFVERYVNRQLNRSRDYGGRIGNVHLQLYRGQYRIDRVGIFKRSGEVHVPLFDADHIYLSIEWKELWHGAVVGQIRLDRPRLNFAGGPTAAESQTGKDQPWNEILKSLFPFDLNRVEIDDGEIHFVNEYAKPPVDLSLQHFSATATNLTNSRDVKNLLPAGAVARGSTIGGGNMEIHVQLNPMTVAPTFQATAQVSNVDLPALNDFLKAYGKFDVASGKFALYTSIASKDGAYDGYAKVFFENLHVFEWDKERGKNALEVFWEAIVGTLAAAFKNQPHDYLATRIPISGTFGKEKV
ncbi:MAG: DUF748 domain-containing protein, partial [Limisphaerales bacterium]